MMKRMLALLLACLLPVTALAVTEGVVEAAPEVEIVLPKTGNTLFGMWEQGLDDIERAARQVLEERLHCPKDMKLVSIEVDEQVFGEQLYTKKWGNEEISSYLYVIFLFEDERMGAPCPVRWALILKRASWGNAVWAAGMTMMTIRMRIYWICRDMAD